MCLHTIIFQTNFHEHWEIQLDLTEYYVKKNQEETNNYLEYLKYFNKQQFYIDFGKSD